MFRYHLSGAHRVASLRGLRPAYLPAVLALALPAEAVGRLAAGTLALLFSVNHLYLHATHLSEHKAAKSPVKERSTPLGASLAVK